MSAPRIRTRVDHRCPRRTPPFVPTASDGAEHRGESLDVMVAYVISEVEIIDETQGQRYRELAAASIARYSGRYLVRGAEPLAVEGEWPAARRMVMVEFPSMDRARQWYASAEYAEALEVRRTALTRRLIFAEGVPAHTDTQV